MNAETMQLFTAMLTVMTLGAVAITWVARFSRRAAWARTWIATLREHRVLAGALVAGAAMAGSLWFSEVAGYVPCTLCWYQRIAMYSLAIIGVVAVIRKERPTAYIVTLASIGLLVSIYHYLLERFPSLDAGACSTTLPCEYIWFERFGFITLPFMALTGFLAILTLHTLPEVSS